MPSKNAIKEYEAGAYYHIYNRGVEKRTIFQDDKDYKTFLSYLKFYLTEPIDPIDLNLPDALQGSSLKVYPSRKLKNYFNDIDLLAFCLMPNHFHLLVHQQSETAINNFMRSLSTKYVRYFNTKHKRVGHLFQNIYKAVKIDNEYQWLHLSKYIHRNPLDLLHFKDHPRSLAEYKYSSYPNYLGNINQIWVNPVEILSQFKNPTSYRNFIEENIDITPIYDLALDYES